MKRKLMILGTMAASLMLLGGQASAQYYRTGATGNWSVLGTWQSSTDSSTWVAATLVPTGSEKILNQSGKTLTFDVDVTISGYFKNLGVVALGTGTPAPVVTVTGTYEHAIDGGTLLSCTWATGSTVYIDSTKTATSIASGGTQNFYNYVWNCPKQTSNFGASFATGSNPGITIGGDVTILATAASPTAAGRFQFFASGSGRPKITGNLNVSGNSNVTLQGTSGGSFDTLDIYGSVNVNTKGYFAIAKGSQGASGYSFWNFYGDVSIVTRANGNSNTTTDGAKFRFVKNGSQNFGLTVTGRSDSSSGNFMPVEVATGSNVVLTTPVHVTTLYLAGGKITSSASDTLILGWYNGVALTLTSGVVSATAPGSATSYVNGPLSYLVLAVGATSKTYPIGKGTAFRPVTLSLNQTNATLSTYTAEMFLGDANALNSVASTDLNHVSYKDYYKIAESAGGSAFAAGAVTLSYGTQGVDDKVWDVGATRVVQGPNSPGTWIDRGTTGSTTPAPTGSSQVGTITSSVAFTDLTTDTYFALGSTTAGSDNPLPVEMTSFTATASASDGTTLHWSMASELNNSGWDVQRANVDANGNVSAFTKIGYVKGSLNSVETTTYSFVDRTALYGTFEYRLNQIDVNGNSKFSNPIKVAQLELPKTVELGTYPNPFNPTATLRYGLPEAGSVGISVYNSIGQLVTTLVDRDMDAGIFEVSFNASSLPSGMYFARLGFVGKVNNTVKITKMLLVK